MAILKKYILVLGHVLNWVKYSIALLVKSRIILKKMIYGILETIGNHFLELKASFIIGGNAYARRFVIQILKGRLEGRNL